MSYTDEFKRSSGGPKAVPLTTSAGVALTPDADAPAFFKLTAAEAATLSFYIDWDGSRNLRINDINVTASAEVACTVALKWRILGADKEKYGYAMTLTGTQALGGCNTAYPFIEDCPPGTKQWIEVAVAGACTVSVNVMGRYS